MHVPSALGVNGCQLRRANRLTGAIGTRWTRTVRWELEASDFPDRWDEPSSLEIEMLLVPAPQTQLNPIGASLRHEQTVGSRSLGPRGARRRRQAVICPSIVPRGRSCFPYLPATIPWIRKTGKPITRHQLPS